MFRFIINAEREEIVVSDNVIIDKLITTLAAFNKNDIATASEGLHPDITYIIRGRATVSGVYEGREAVATALSRIKELTSGTLIGEPEVIMAQGDEIMMYMLVSGTRPDGRTYENYQAYLYRYKDGKMIEGQTIPVDQYAFEQFFID
jgi:ketosteroid isomerase-like protein